MRLTVVGSGTAAPTPERVCSGYWVDAGDQRLLLDVGPGTVHRMARLGLAWPDLDHLLLTHFHNDHTGDLPMLFFALKHGVREPRETPLTIWAPRGIGGRLAAMAAAFGDHVSDPGFPVIVREMEPGAAFDAGPVAVRAARTPHTDASLAYGLEHDGVTLGYTGDTGPSAAVAEFLSGVDTLIAECSVPEEHAMATHLTPPGLAAMANAAGPRRLVVTHVYPLLERLDPVARVRDAGWEGETVRAEDGMAMDVRP